MEESVILHRLESRLAGQKIEAIDELIGIVRESGKLHFNNKLSLFSSFKRILQDEDLLLRTKCTKLICDLLPKLATDMDTCMSFVMPNILGNMAANNLVLKRESIKLVRCFSEITSDKNALIRSVIWEGIDSKNPLLAREVILSLDKLILNILQTEDCYNIVTALCKRFYVEENKKVKKAIKESFNSITTLVSLTRMEELITQLPSSAVTSGRELLQTYKHTDKPKVISYKSSSKLEVDSAISLEGKLLWDLIPDSTLTKLHGDDVAEQLKSISELECAIRRVTTPSNFLICIDEICEAIIRVIPVNNFRVFKASTVLVSAFVEVFRDVLGECVYPLTRALCHKIGDNKIAVREGTMKCLTQLMKICGPRPVLEVVLVNFRDRNPRVREEAINVVIKSMLTFPVQDIDVSAVAEHLAAALGDNRQRVVNTALEAITVLKERIPYCDMSIIYRAVEKVDTPDKKYFNAIKDRLDKGTMSKLNDAGLVTHGEGCFSRNTTSLTGTTSKMSNESVSVPTTSQERMLSKDGTSCPPTPLSLPRRYYSAGRNRLPWERPSRQNTLIYNNQGTTDEVRAVSDRSHVFIKGGGARSDGGSYAQIHLKKMQMEANVEDNTTTAAQNNAPRSNTLGSLKKYFPSVKGSPDPKRSWPTVKSKDDEVVSNGSAPQKSNSFSNDSYGVQTSSMYANYRVNSGESSGVGTLTNNTPNGSATVPPRQSHFSPVTTLNDSGIFEEHSFVNSKEELQEHITRTPVITHLTRTRTVSFTRERTKKLHSDEPLRSILKKPRDNVTSLVWGRAQTFTQARSVGRKKRRAYGMLKPVQQESITSKMELSSRPVRPLKKSSRKSVKYYPKPQEQVVHQPSIERGPLSPDNTRNSALRLKSGKLEICKKRPQNDPTFAPEPLLLPTINSVVLPKKSDILRKKSDILRNKSDILRNKSDILRKKSESVVTGRVSLRNKDGLTLPSITHVERSTPVTTEEERTSPQVPEDLGYPAQKEGRSAARRDIRQEEDVKRAEEERLELAKWEKIRMEELAKEEKRRKQLRVQLQHENELAEQHHLNTTSTQHHLKEEAMRIDSYHIGNNGYVELTSQNLAKKKLKAAAEESRKPRPKLLKARTRTESVCNEPDSNIDIDIVGKGLSSHHIDLDGATKEPAKDKRKVSEDKHPLRAPSGVYGQRVHPSRSPDEGDASLSDNSDNSDEEISNKEERVNREGHPIGSGLSAATRMRFEKKRAQYVERQSAEQRAPPEEATTTTRYQHGKPVSAPVESRLNLSDTAVKRSPSKPQVRASSLLPHHTPPDTDQSHNSSLVDEKENVPLVNPDAAAAEAVRNLKIGGEQWNYKVQGLHVLRRLALHHPHVIQTDILTYIRLVCGEVPNLRSQVSRLAIQIIGTYFTSLKTAMDADLDRTCDCLLNKTSELNQFIRNDIVTTLGKMVECATPIRVLTALTNSGTYHKNRTVRSISALCFKDVVARMGVSRCLNNKEVAPKFISALDKLSHDGNQETRYYGRLIVSWCMETTNFDSLCQRHLPANSARSMRDLCDKLQTKGVGPLPQTSDRTSGRYRSQPVSRAQSNLSATYPTNRSRKPSPTKKISSPDKQAIAAPSFSHVSSPNYHGLLL